MNTGVRCCWYSHSETKKSGSLNRNLYVNDKSKVVAPPRTQHIPQRKCGKICESGRDMIRQEKALGEGRKRKRNKEKLDLFS